MSLRSHPVFNLSFRSATLGSVGSPGTLGSPMAAREEATAALDADHDPAGIAIGAPDSQQLLEPLLRGKPKAGPSRLGATLPGAPSGEGPLPVTLLEDSPDASKGSSFASLVVILSKTIVGAGSAALPRAFVLLGLLLAGGFLLLMGYMTHWSIEALTLGTVVTGHMSYPEVVRQLCGRGGSLLLQLSLVFRCAGLMIVYVIITADILAGHEDAPGLVCDLLGAKPSGWCGSRQLLAAVVAVCCMAPLITPKRLASTAITSWIGLVSVGTWAVVTLGLAVAAAVQGKASMPRLLPDFEAFSGGAAQVATQLVAVIPILATAYTCQMTVHHIMRDLVPFSVRRMGRVSASAVTVCTVLFLTVAVGSQLAFGPGVPADVLTQFNAAKLEPLVGPALARLLYILVRTGFLLSIITIFPMQMAPYRESLSRLLAGTELSGGPYYLLTYASLALFYFVAMHSGSIWVPLQFVGATAGALIAFIFPAWIALSAIRCRDPAALASQNYWKINAWGLIAIGIAQAVAGVTATLFFSHKDSGSSNGALDAALAAALF
jgi:amino acid permease